MRNRQRDRITGTQAHKTEIKETSYLMSQTPAVSTKVSKTRVNANMKGPKKVSIKPCAQYESIPIFSGHNDALTVKPESFVSGGQCVSTLRMIALRTVLSRLELYSREIG